MVVCADDKGGSSANVEGLVGGLALRAMARRLYIPI